MRRRLKHFLPIVLFALAVQIFAPIGACWAASIAASDPLARTVICHGNGVPGSAQSDRTGSHQAHDGCCSACSLLQTGAPLDTPLTALIFTFDSRAAAVVWHEFPSDFGRDLTGSPAQARAPPSFS